MHEGWANRSKAKFRILLPLLKFFAEKWKMPKLDQELSSANAVNFLYDKSHLLQWKLLLYTLIFWIICS